MERAKMEKTVNKNKIIDNSAAQVDISKFQPPQSHNSISDQTPIHAHLAICFNETKRTDRVPSKGPKPVPPPRQRNKEEYHLTSPRPNTQEITPYQKMENKSYQHHQQQNFIQQKQIYPQIPTQLTLDNDNLQINSSIVCYSKVPASVLHRSSDQLSTTSLRPKLKKMQSLPEINVTPQHTQSTQTYDEIVEQLSHPRVTRSISRKKVQEKQYHSYS